MIAPSILSFDFLTLGQAVPELAEAGAEVLHLDVMDGQFVPPITFGDCLVKSLRPVATMPMEAHLMTLTPERHFDAFIEAGCSRVTFHVEATAHAYRHAQSLRDRGIEAGIALNPGTPVEMITPLLDVVDLVLVMTVNPGWGGQSFLPDTLSKIRQIHKMRPELRIQVDGGITPETIGVVHEAGASLFVVGSYLLRANSLKSGIQELHRACELKP